MKAVSVAPGTRFGRWTTLEEVSRIVSGSKRRFFRCRCDCGTLGLASLSALRFGGTQSCGCLRIERLPRRHGHATAQRITPEYRSWCHLKERCLNPRVHNYHRYGGRGIRVCDKWLNSFAAFIADVGLRPSPKHSLDRIKNDGHYEPGNVQWALPHAQAANKGNNRIVTFDGKTQHVSAWARELNVSEHRLRDRLSAGWSVRDALTTPPRDH